MNDTTSKDHPVDCDRAAIAGHGSRDRRFLLLLAVFVGAAVVFGAVARLRGLGRWPLAMDEYYLARSVQNILRVGLPEYPCGGFYLRGLALQYGSALLERAGLMPELALRLIAAVSSLLALPAAYLLGKRLGGERLGLTAVAILALSVWEIEMGRFGRMYAPFQTIFLWYLIFFFARTIDGDRRALVPMLALSVLGMAVWEGGALVALANFLPPVIERPSGRFTRRDWVYLGAMGLIFAVGYHFSTLEMLPSSNVPDLPPDYRPPPPVHLSRLDAGVMPLTTLAGHPFWLVAALLPAAVGVFAALRIVGARREPLATLGLIAVLAAALLQQFGLAFGLVIVCLLLSILDWPSIAARDTRPVWAAVLTSAAFWVAFGLATHDWHSPGLAPAYRVALLGYQFVRFPDFFRVVVVQLARVVPGLGLALLVLLGAAVIRAVRRADDTPPAERVALAVLAIMLLAASAPSLPRYETRYVFFLYPLAVILALRMIERGVQTFAPPRLATSRHLAGAAAVILSLCGFALSEDFRPRHLWNIDTAAVNFRIGMSEAEAQHYHPRSDVRSAALWVAAHADPARDVVVNSFPGVDFYFPKRGFPTRDFFFMEETDPRFDGCSCREGTVERWSNLPLLHSVAMLQSQVSASAKVWMIVDAADLPSLLSRLPRDEWKLEWASRARRIIVISLRNPASSPATAKAPLSGTAVAVLEDAAEPSLPGY